MQAGARGTAPLLPGSSSLKHSTLLPPTCPHPYQTNNTHLKSKKLSLRNPGSGKWQAGDCAGHMGPGVLIPLLLSPRSRVPLRPHPRDSEVPLEVSLEDSSCRKLLLQEGPPQQVSSLPWPAPDSVQGLGQLTPTFAVSGLPPPEDREGRSGERTAPQVFLPD